MKNNLERNALSTLPALAARLHAAIGRKLPAPSSSLPSTPTPTLNPLLITRPEALRKRKSRSKQAANGMSEPGNDRDRSLLSARFFDRNVHGFRCQCDTCGPEAQYHLSGTRKPSCRKFFPPLTPANLVVGCNEWRAECGPEQSERAERPIDRD